MAYFKICRNCGDRLDPGERCECRSVEQQERLFWQNRVAKEQDGQGSFDFEPERMVV